MPALKMILHSFPSVSLASTMPSLAPSIPRSQSTLPLFCGILLLPCCHSPYTVFLFGSKQLHSSFSWIKHSQHAGLIKAKPVWTLEIVQQLMGFTESYASSTTLEGYFKVSSKPAFKTCQFNHANFHYSFYYMEPTFQSMNKGSEDHECYILTIIPNYQVIVREVECVWERIKRD